jgi:hypothetical protein
MSRKMILLNLALLLLTGALVWQERRHYLEMKAHERDVLRQAAKARLVLPPPPAAVPLPVAPYQYIDVAQRTLFAKDRNPNVVIEPPKPEPEPPMPALPSYYGQINFSDPVIFMSIRGGAQKRYRVGEKIGDFELIEFDAQKVVLGWNKKRIEKKLDELKVKVEQAQMEQPASPNAAPPPASAGGVQVKSLGGNIIGDAGKPDKVVGDVISGTEYKACVMNDPTPAGAVVDGFKKVVTRTLMGNSCLWEKVK